MVYQWCNDCHTFQDTTNSHNGHSVVTLGENTASTIQCLDDLIQYGQDSISNIQADVENARRVDEEIASTKEKFRATLMKRIEAIVKDVRVALDEHSTQLLVDVERKVEQTAENAKTVIRTSGMKLDTANAFLCKAAVTLPNDDDGTFDENQLKEVYNHFRTLEKINRQPKPNVKSVNVNMKFPNTMKMKTQCRELSKKLVGEIENTDKPSLLNAQAPSIDVLSLDDFNGA